MPEKHHHSINYVELPANDMAAIKTFYTEVFGWRFEDYGPDYLAFFDAALDGGFYRSALTSTPANGAALVVFYSADIERTSENIEAAGGKIVKPVFEFPGGRRFHFTDPHGNELAVWSESANTNA